MGILTEDIQQLRETADIVAVIGRYVELKKDGQQWAGLCPFHAERTPSFKVHPNRGLYHCLAGETEVITWEGVRQIRDLAGTTQKILTKNPHGGQAHWVEAPFMSFGEQRLMEITLTRNGQRKTIRATPEHRWFVRRWKRLEEMVTGDLKAKDRLVTALPPPSLKFMSAISPVGVQAGFTFGDGTKQPPSGARADLHGDKDAELLKWFPLNHTRVAPLPDDKQRTLVSSLPYFFKDPPPIGAPQYLAGWLAGYFAADGTVAEDGTAYIESAHRENIELVRQVATRLGILTYGIVGHKRVGINGKKSTMWRTHFAKDSLTEEFFLLSEHRRRFNENPAKYSRAHWVVESVVDLGVTEEVFCAVVPGTHSFVLADHILTGNCHGCKAGGDVITFLMEVEKVDFPAAVEMLAERAGVTLRYEDTETSESAKRRTRLLHLVERAVDFYHDLLLDTSNTEGRDARAYLRARGINGDLARRYKLGWAPDSTPDGTRRAYDRLIKHLNASPYDIEAAGLGFRHEKLGMSDAFRGRIMFPIYDAQGRPVGFGGRLLPGVDGAKYKNSTENALYSKSRVLYGLNWAKQSIVKNDAVVVCEGYTDVIALHEIGVTNAVATCGTALTEDHVRVLRRHASTVIQAFDGDAAGRSAMERMHQWERQYGVTALVAVLPAGSDPADLARSDPDTARQVITDAVPLMRFRVDRVLAAADLTSPEGKARAVDDAMKVVRSHPDPLIRDEYLLHVAAELDLDPDLLRARERRAPAALRDTARSAANQSGPPESSATAALRAIIRSPEDLVLFRAAMFPEGPLRDAFETLASAPNVAAAVTDAPDEVRALLSGLAVTDSTEDSYVIASDLASALVRRALLDASALRRTHSVDPIQLLTEISRLTGWLDELAKDKPNPDLFVEVVRWIDDGCRLASAPEKTP